MQKQRKKPKISNVDCISNSDDEFDDGIVDELVNVDFDAFPAESYDYHGIKTLLAQLLKGLEIDSGALADIIISQNYVGSVVKQVEDSDDDEDDDETMDDDQDEVYGVTTVINLTARKSEPVISSLQSVLLSKFKENSPDSTFSLMSEALQDGDNTIGLLLSERLVNLPPQFAIPIFESLTKEMEEAVKSGKPFNLTHFIMICKIFRTEIPKKKKKKANAAKADVVWSNAEEEVFNEECQCSFDYSIPIPEETSSVPAMWDEASSAKLVPHRRVLVFRADQLSDILSKVKEAVG